MEVAGFKFGFPTWIIRTNSELDCSTPLITSLTPPNAISELKSCAIDGVENEVPIDPLNNNLSIGLKLRESLGSNEESFSTFSYRVANRMSIVSEKIFSISKKIACLFLLDETFLPPPKNSKSAPLIKFPD